MKGYLNRPDANAESFDADGFYRTGDVGYVDEDGMYYIVDRVKELIKVKGFQVPPAELEAVLLGCESIADAAVIGLPCAKVPDTTIEAHHPWSQHVLSSPVNHCLAGGREA
jgi:acyl-CoA synthetase (AMP-forming)/AMP-acid ligase II